MTARAICPLIGQNYAIGKKAPDATEAAPGKFQQGRKYVQERSIKAAHMARYVTHSDARPCVRGHQNLPLQLSQMRCVDFG